MNWKYLCGKIILLGGIAQQQSHISLYHYLCLHAALFYTYTEELTCVRVQRIHCIDIIQYTMMLNELCIYVYENFQVQKSIVCLSCTHAFFIVQMKDFSIFVLKVINSSPIINTKKYSTFGNSSAHTLLHPLISIKNSK